MEVKTEQGLRKCPFGNLSKGQVFSQGNTAYMKTSVVPDSVGVFRCNCVSLNTGELHYFKDDVEVLYQHKAYVVLPFTLTESLEEAQHQFAEMDIKGGGSD